MIEKVSYQFNLLIAVIVLYVKYLMKSPVIISEKFSFQLIL